jgi:hypothetical protein
LEILSQLWKRKLRGNASFYHLPGPAPLGLGGKVRFRREPKTVIYKGGNGEDYSVFLISVLLRDPSLAVKLGVTRKVLYV